MHHVNYDGGPSWNEIPISTTRLIAHDESGPPFFLPHDRISSLQPGVLHCLFDHLACLECA